MGDAAARSSLSHFRRPPCSRRVAASSISRSLRRQAASAHTQGSAVQALPGLLKSEAVEVDSFVLPERREHRRAAS